MSDNTPFAFIAAQHAILPLTTNFLLTTCYVVADPLCNEYFFTTVNSVARNFHDLPNLSFWADVSDNTFNCVDNETGAITEFPLNDAETLVVVQCLMKLR